LIERYQVYQLTVPTVPVGGITDVPLQLDSDAPFLLRLVRSRGIGLNGWRFQTARKTWQSNALRTDWSLPMDPLGSPYPTRGAIVYPELVYPASAQIVVDIGNTTGEELTNARLMFFGSKLFRDGALFSPTYPAKFSTLPFCYPTDVLQLPLAASATAPAIQRDVQLRVLQDADFVYRYGVCDPFTIGVEGGIVPLGFFAGVQPSYDELYVQVRDESRKAYSNEPIHINDWFPQGLPPTNAGAPLSPAGQDQQGVSPSFPGLVVPEIYIERQHALYIDLYRYDTTGFPVDLHFRFQGAKVFKRT